MFDPNNDGIDHINVYSQGKTMLGVFLSNWYRYHISLPELGDFSSVEGLWYYLSTKDERLRTVSGFSAKQLGKSLPVVNRLPEDEFRSIIKEAIKIKVVGPQFFNFINSTLPFTHYYVFSGKQVDAGHKWIVEYLEELRNELKDKLKR